MELESESDIPKLFFSITEVARQMEVSPSLIRFWEKSFPELKPRKTARGVRQFTQTDIQILKSIHHLVKDRGFTLQGAREAIQKSGGSGAIHSRLEAIQRLKEVRKQLLALKESLGKA
jgi:DNA-binding transcriptional MerR regulator